jgi:hypothetical protein
VSENEQQMLISIRPEPTPEEMAAIVAAIAVALREDPTLALWAGSRSSPTFGTAPVLSQPSRWARQGRLEAMRGMDVVE